MVRETPGPHLLLRARRMSQGHDAAAALVVDGECVAAAAEERFKESALRNRVLAGNASRAA